MRVRSGANGTGSRADDELTLQRARLLAARAERASLELEELQGVLVRAEDVQRAWSEMIAAARRRLLAIPRRVAPQVSKVKAAAAEKILKRAIYQAMEGLSGDEKPGQPRPRSPRR